MITLAEELIRSVGARSDLVTHAIKRDTTRVIRAVEHVCAAVVAATLVRQAIGVTVTPASVQVISMCVNFEKILLVWAKAETRILSKFSFKA